MFDSTPAPFDISQAQQQQLLPSSFASLDMWNPAFDFTSAGPPATTPALERYVDATAGAPPSGFEPFASPSQVPWTDYLYPPSADMAEQADFGLTQEEQVELMESLAGPGAMGAVQGILDATNRVFYPPGRQPM